MKIPSLQKSTSTLERGKSRKHGSPVLRTAAILPCRLGQSVLLLSSILISAEQQGCVCFSSHFSLVCSVMKHQICSLSSGINILQPEGNLFYTLVNQVILRIKDCFFPVLTFSSLTVGIWAESISIKYFVAFTFFSFLLNFGSGVPYYKYKVELGDRVLVSPIRMEQQLVSMSSVLCLFAGSPGTLAGLPVCLEEGK